MSTTAAAVAPELAAIGAELAELEAFERWRGGRLADGEADAYRQRLAAAVRGEILNAAVLIAAMTSIANAVEGRSPSRTERAALTVFAPMHSAHFETAVERLMANELAIEDCWRLQSYLARLALSRRMSETLAGRRREADIDAEIHADAWRRTAAATLAAIASLDAMAGPVQPGADEAAARRTVDLLRAAAAGSSPCLDPEGRVTVPGWAERRRESRLTLNVVATAIVGGQTLAAIIRDASPSGLGVTLSAEVAAGCAIVVRLADGREIAGRVAWCVGRRAGVRLDSRLEPAELAARRRV